MAIDEGNTDAMNNLALVFQFGENYDDAIKYYLMPSN